MDQYDLATRGDSDGLWDWDLGTDRVHFSPRWMALLGCDEREIGNTPDEWLSRVHPEELDAVRAALESHLASGPDDFEFRHRMRSKDGNYRWMSCRAVVVREEGGQASRLMGSHTDVTAETVTDAQTGLPNRLLLLDHLSRSLERSHRRQGFHFAVLLLDLDRSEARGSRPDSSAGDVLLSAAARRLETSLRRNGTPETRVQDHLVARLRGDEFAILLDGLHELADARTVADRVLTDILAPFSVGGREVYLAASIGIALSATGYTRAEDVLRDADTALYRAKLLGRARCEVFDTAIVKSVESELQLEADFRTALDRGQFVLHFQPIVALATSRIAGFEALVRWEHPGLGLVPPGEFIPIAEKTGLIAALGGWILREACRQLKAWQDAFTIPDDLWVSVNLSSPQFSRPGLVDQIAATLREAGLEARRLMLELTESVAMDNPAAVKGMLIKLRVMGARVGLDDFGTGQSSLAYLHQFPADFLKVDRAFVRDMESRADVRNIVAAVVTLARQLGLRVIAEGIETPEQLKGSRSLGCEFGQGFLFSRPVDSDCAARLLQAGLQAPSAGAAAVEPAPAASGAAGHDEDAASAGTGNRWLRWLRQPAFVAVAAASTLMLAGIASRFAGSAGPPPVPPAPLTAAWAPATAPILTAGPVPASPSREATAASSAKTASSPAARATSATFAVIHKRTLKDARGKLFVSRAGVSFIPDKDDAGKAALSLKYGQFSWSLSDDDLTIRTPTKAYRFKAADASSKQANREQLKRISDRIAGARPANTPR